MSFGVPVFESEPLQVRRGSIMIARIQVYISLQVKGNFAGGGCDSVSALGYTLSAEVTCGSGGALSGSLYSGASCSGESEPFNIPGGVCSGPSAAGPNDDTQFWVIGQC